MSSDQSLSPEQEPLEHRRALRVLVVDDMSSMRMLIKVMLKQMGILDVVEAGDGIEAINYLSRAQVDLLICDWNMPGATGLDVLIHVRERLALKRLPFLMVTAEQGRDHFAKATEAGVTAYLVKPFGSADFRQHIDFCLSSLS